MNKQKLTDGLTALETSAQLHKDAVNYMLKSTALSQKAVELFNEAVTEESETMVFKPTEDAILTFDPNKTVAWVDDKGFNVASVDAYRKYVVDLAKEEVEDAPNKTIHVDFEHKKEDITKTEVKGCKIITQAKMDEKFIVNKEKRTVVCLLVGHKSGHVYAKGIAKCDPNDTFNEHLGKLIAFYRAVSEEVPEIFLTVPNPEDFKNGDRVINTETENEFVLSEVKSGANFVADFYDIELGRTYYGFITPSETMKRVYKVLDDSNRK